MSLLYWLCFQIFLIQCSMPFYNTATHLPSYYANLSHTLSTVANIRIADLQLDGEDYGQGEDKYMS